MSRRPYASFNTLPSTLFSAPTSDLIQHGKDAHRLTRRHLIRRAVMIIASKRELLRSTAASPALGPESPSALTKTTRMPATRQALVKGCIASLRWTP